MFKYCAHSGKGTRRKINEDRIMIDNMILQTPHYSGKNNSQFMAVVCDGVGCTNSGGLAAEKIAKSFKYFEIDSCSPLVLFRHLYKVNRDIVAEQSKDPNTKAMASTVAGLIMIKNRYLLFNLGDTRIYSFHNGKLRIVTKDHIEPSMDNCITSYLGGNGFACFPSFRKGVLENRCKFLMCSDGIYKSIKDDDLKGILGANTEIEEKERAIMKLALRNGSTDDKSLVLVEYVADQSSSVGVSPNE